MGHYANNIVDDSVVAVEFEIWSELLDSLWFSSVIVLPNAL